MTLESITIDDLEVLLRPMNILIGLNGTGKSKFTHLLPLLKAYYQTKDYDVEYNIKKLLGNNSYSIKYKGKITTLNKGLLHLYEEELTELLLSVGNTNIFNNLININARDLIKLSKQDFKFFCTYIESLLDLVDLKLDSSNTVKGIHRINKYELNLQDSSNSVKHISQLVFNSILVKEGGTYVMNHPELYLHPNKHLELGSLISDLWIKRGVRTLVETHSENLILRLSKLVSKGLLDCSDIVVVYLHINEDSNSIEIRHLYFKSDGTYTWNKEKHKGSYNVL